MQIDPAGTFVARLLVAGPPDTATFAGRWAVARGFIGTAVVVPRWAPSDRLHSELVLGSSA